MQAIVTALQYVLGKIVAAVKWFGELFVKVFESLWLLLQDLVCWGFESIIELVVSILGTFDFSGLASYSGAWAGLPPQTIEVLSAIGLSQAMGIVISAITIRIGLQLVPFTRLGS